MMPLAYAIAFLSLLRTDEFLKIRLEHVEEETSEC